MNIPVIKYMGLTVIYVIISVLFVNHVLIKNLNLSDNFPEVFQGALFFLILFSLWGYYVCVNSSYDKCQKKDHVKAILNGFVVASVGVVAYIVVFFMEFLQAPFIELFGNNYGNDIAEIFFITLNLLVVVVSKYFNIAKDVCAVNANEITKNFKGLDDFLETAPCNDGSDKAECANIDLDARCSSSATPAPAAAPVTAASTSGSAAASTTGSAAASAPST